MLEILKNIAPMILAVMFTYTAAVFAGAGFQKKGDRKIAFVGAGSILLVSFTIWWPSFNDLFDAVGLLGEDKRAAMIISISCILLGFAIATFINVRKKIIWVPARVFTLKSNGEDFAVMGGKVKLAISFFTNDYFWDKKYENIS